MFVIEFSSKVTLTSTSLLIPCAFPTYVPGVYFALVSVEESLVLVALEPPVLLLHAQSENARIATNNRFI